MRQITLSPLPVTMHSDDKGGFHSATLYAVKKDGTELAAVPGEGRCSNVGAVGGEGWSSFSTWSFEEPVDVADVAFLSLKGTLIPVN